MDLSFVYLIPFINRILKYYKDFHPTDDDDDDIHIIILVLL